MLYETTGSEIGQRGTLDCAFGMLSRDQAFSVDTDGRLYYRCGFSHIRKPVALCIQDLIVHKPSFPGIRPELLVHLNQQGEQTLEVGRNAPQFSVEERITSEGRADLAGLADVPRYSDLLRTGANAMGWDLSEFEVYRLRMAYPILLSTSSLYFYVEQEGGTRRSTKKNGVAG